MPMRTEVDSGMQRLLDASANRVGSLLAQQQQTLVAAESCTAGLIVATLARVAGISSHVAGGFVVYQVASKVIWLGISDSLIKEHGVVSSAMSRAMAEAALIKTPHASISIGITGHLGPNAPGELDGVAWLGFAKRNEPTESVRLNLRSTVLLSSNDPLNESQQLAIRHDRQQDAVLQSLNYLCRKLVD